MAKLIVKCWTDRKLQRGDDGVVRAMAVRYNYLGTGLCAACRHQSCGAKKGYAIPGLKGMCEKVTPVCTDDEDKLCKELGAPPAPTWAPRDNAVVAILNHTMRKKAVEKYLHERFLKCRPVTLTVVEGHKR